MPLRWQQMPIEACKIAARRDSPHASGAIMIRFHPSLAVAKSNSELKPATLRFAVRGTFFAFFAGVYEL